MIAFRQVDRRYPFLWADARQPAGRWHADGEGPAHYFADTPDGAWAEFLRHEEITDAEDVATIRRQIWAIEIGAAPAEHPALPERVLTGGLESYARCQAEARRLREAGVRRMVAPSAALTRGGARGVSVDGLGDAIRQGAARDGRVIVIFGAPGELIGWIAADGGFPSADLLERVHHY